MPSRPRLHIDLVCFRQIAITHHVAHAKGVLLSGYFQPTAEAAGLSTAPHFCAPRTPVIARFSNSTGLPEIRDTDPNSNPKGLAVRFKLGDRKHTDIISHSTPYFPTRTGEEFLQLLGAIQNGTIESFLDQHPAAKAFVSAPKPTPEGFGTLSYYGINAFIMVNAAGEETFVRYTFAPVMEKFIDEEVKRPDNFLFDSLPDTLANGGIVFRLLAQIAQAGDVTDDATVHWESDRRTVELGSVVLESTVEDSKGEEKKIIFDPIPRVDGIEPSLDPLLQMRADVYLISGKGRRGA